MAKVKKYQWGTFSASGANPQMVNPGNAALKQYTTTSSSSIPDGSLPTSGDISQVAYSKDKLKGPSFKDKAGAFMGNYGGAITQAAGSLMPLLMKKPDPNAKPYKKGTNLIKYQAAQVVEPQGEVGPSRKEAADLMRTYNKTNKNNPNVIGNVDEEEVATREKELKNLTTSNKTKAPITYSKDSFAGPSKEELESGKKKEVSENAERARKTYETRLAASAARNQYEKEQAIEGEKNMAGPSREDLIRYKKESNAYDASIKSGISPSLTAPTFTKESVERAIEKQAGGPVSTEKKPILYKETKEKNPYISFKQMSAADQKKYRAGMASGNKFEVGGREYAAATSKEQAFSKRMETKSNKPVVKNIPKQKNQNMDEYSLPGYKEYNKRISKSIWDNIEQNTAVKPQNSNLNIKKTAKHTTDDPGKKMVNSNQDTLVVKIQKDRDLYKQKKEEEKKPRLGRWTGKLGQWN